MRTEGVVEVIAYRYLADLSWDWGRKPAGWHVTYLDLNAALFAGTPRLV